MHLLFRSEVIFLFVSTPLDVDLLGMGLLARYSSIQDRRGNPTLSINVNLMSSLFQTHLTFP
jgi:hypothetical protein